MAGNEEQQHKHPQSALAGVENGAEWQENNLAEQAHEHGRQCGERIELALAFAFVLFADGIRRSSYMVGEGRDQSVGRQRWDGSGGTATVDYLVPDRKPCLSLWGCQFFRREDLCRRGC